MSRQCCASWSLSRRLFLSSAIMTSSPQDGRHFHFPGRFSRWLSVSISWSYLIAVVISVVVMSSLRSLAATVVAVLVASSLCCSRLSPTKYGRRGLVCLLLSSGFHQIGTLKNGHQNVSMQCWLNGHDRLDWEGFCRDLSHFTFWWNLGKMHRLAASVFKLPKKYCFPLKVIRPSWYLFCQLSGGLWLNWKSFWPNLNHFFWYFPEKTWRPSAFFYFPASAKVCGSMAMAGLIRWVR